IPLARATLLRPVLDLLDHVKVDLSTRLETARPLLHDPAALIPIAMGGALFEEAARCYGGADVGFRAGAAISVLAACAWGRVAAGFAAVGAFVAARVTQTRRFNSGNRFWVVQRGDEVRLHQCFSSRLVRGRAVACELALMLILDAMRLALGPDW